MYEEDIIKGQSNSPTPEGNEQWTFLDDYQKQVQISQQKYQEPVKAEDSEDEEDDETDATLGVISHLL